MAEDDEGRGHDGAVMEGHDQLVPLELPHLVGDGLYFAERVTVVTENKCKLRTVQLCTKLLYKI